MTLFEIILISISGLTFLLVAIPLSIKLIAALFKKTKFKKMGSSSQIRLIRQLHDAVTELSATKTGAIITIVNKEDIESLRTDGIKIDANISSSLIISIFNKKSPLHDGALIIDGNKITYAATYYKITSKSVDNKYGARHRAALGISEQSDSLTIVVSEETGGVAFVKAGALHKVKLTDFQEKIVEYM